MYVYPNILLKQEPHGLNRFLAKRTLLSREEMKRQNWKVIPALIVAWLLFVAAGIVGSSYLTALIIPTVVLGMISFFLLVTVSVNISVDVMFHDGCATSLRALLLLKREGHGYTDIDHSEVLKELAGGTSYDHGGAWRHPHRENASRTWFNDHREYADVIQEYLSDPFVQSCEQFLRNHPSSKDPMIASEIQEWKKMLRTHIEAVHDKIKAREEAAAAQAKAEGEMWLIKSQANRGVFVPKNLL